MHHHPRNHLVFHLQCMDFRYDVIGIVDLSNPQIPGKRLLPECLNHTIHIKNMRNNMIYLLSIYFHDGHFLVVLGERNLLLVSWVDFDFSIGYVVEIEIRFNFAEMK